MATKLPQDNVKKTKGYISPMKKEMVENVKESGVQVYHVTISIPFIFSSFKIILLLTK
jgi:ppGpp synthetase/RelA/SpoT-type nucleotidyltranferase